MLGPDCTHTGQLGSGLPLGCGLSGWCRGALSLSEVQALCLVFQLVNLAKCGFEALVALGRLGDVGLGDAYRREGLRSSLSHGQDYSRGAGPVAQMEP